MNFRFILTDLLRTENATEVVLCKVAVTDPHCELKVIVLFWHNCLYH